MAVRGRDESGGTSQRGFDPRDLESAVIAFPLLKRMQQNPDGVQRVLIALHTLHNGYGDPDGAAKRVHLEGTIGRSVGQVAASSVIAR